MSARGGTLPDSDGHALTVNQLALWEYQSSFPGSRTYGMVGLARACEGAQIGLMRRVWKDLLERHEVLRCRIEARPEGPRAVVSEVMAIPDEELLPVIDATGWSVAQLDADLAARFDDACALDGPTLFRGVAMLVEPWAISHLSDGREPPPDHQRPGGSTWILVMTAHHLVVDFLSFRLILDELDALYRAASGTSEARVRSVADAAFWAFAGWQRDWLASAEGRGAVDEALAAVLPVPPELAFEGLRAGGTAAESAEHRFEFSGAARAALLACAQTYGVTPYVAMLSAFQVLVSLHGGSRDISVATPVHGRSRRDFRRTIGYFANAVPVRETLRPGDTFAALMMRNQASLRRALRLGAVPFPSLNAAAARHSAGGGRNALGQVALIWDVLESGSTTRERESWFETLRVEQTGTPYDLSLTVYAEARRWICGVRYRRPALGANVATVLAQDLPCLACRLTDAPEAALAALSLVPAPGWHAALPAPEPEHGDLVESRMQGHAREVGMAAALMDGARVVTFEELEQRTRGLAAVLRLQATGAAPVAILGERGVDLVLLIVAAYRAGLPYVPLNPAQTDAWLAQALVDSRPQRMLCTTALADRARRLLPGCATHEELLAQVSRDPEPPPQAPPRDALAYIIYTSGSTGSPKGVAVTRASLGALLAGGTGTDHHPQRWTLAHHPGFDFSAWEMWTAITGGHGLRVLGEHEVGAPAAVHAAVMRDGVTHMGLTPAAAQLLLPHLERHGVGKLRTVCIGGASVAPALSARLLSLGMEVWIYYGPTEATVWATRLPVTGPQTGLAIGAPLPGMRAYVLDDWLQWLPEGRTGELYLAGPQLASYYRAAAQTADAFVPDPWHAGERMYRTGDLARYRDNGGLEFVGRHDRQVKVNGYRVELDDIEQRLLAAGHGLTQVCCAQGGDMGLVVVYATGSERGRSDEELQAVARAVLPRHLLPLRFVHATTLPLTENGKPDVRAALALARRQPAGPPAPLLQHSRLVAIICEGFRDELGLRVGATENFMEAGAGSLGLARVCARLGLVLDAPPELADMYMFGTAEKLAGWLARTGTGTAAQPPEQPGRVRSWRERQPRNPRGARAG